MNTQELEHLLERDGEVRCHTVGPIRWNADHGDHFQAATLWASSTVKVTGHDESGYYIVEVLESPNTEDVGAVIEGVLASSLEPVVDDGEPQPAALIGVVTPPNPDEHRAEHERHVALGEPFRHGCRICVPDDAPLEALVQDVIDAANDVVRETTGFTGVTVTRDLPTGDGRRLDLVNARITVTAPDSTHDGTLEELAAAIAHELAHGPAAVLIHDAILLLGRRNGVELSVEVTT